MQPLSLRMAGICFCYFQDCWLQSIQQWARVYTVAVLNDLQGALTAHGSNLFLIELTRPVIIICVLWNAGAIQDGPDDLFLIQRFDAAL